MTRSKPFRSGPDFLCIGAQRSGSSWLNKQMKAHPDIWVPPMKEVHYFDLTRNEPFWNPRYQRHLKQTLRRNARQLVRGGWKAKPFLWDLNYCFRQRTDEWYSSLFTNAEESVAGESTPAYAILPRRTIQDIRALYPDLKIVFIMRDPIDRSWSSAVHWLARGRGRSIAAVPLEEIRAFIHSEPCLLRSDYARTLDNWLACFDESQLFLAYFDEIEEAPDQLLERLYGFLGVAYAPDGMGDQRRNAVNAAARNDASPPEDILRELAHMYRPKVRELVDRGYVGYPGRWLRRAEVLSS